MIQKAHNLASYLYNKLMLRGALSCLVFLLFMPLSYIQAQQVKPSSNQVINEFNERTRQYMNLRGQVVSKLAKPKAKSQPAEIKAYQTALEERLRTARANAQQGDLFMAEVAAHIRKVIKKEFRGKRLAALQKDVAEAQTQGVPLRVNYPYPENKERLEMPPTLLLKLPLLPQELRYRLVGTNLLLVDREAQLIIDYMTEALPPSKMREKL